MRILLNIILRLSVIYFALETLFLPSDPRWAGKAITPRNLVFVAVFSIIIPLLFYLGKRWERYPFKKWDKYPWWLDNLYLSTVWLDMAGNHFNLYDTYFYFDLIPHFYVSGVIVVVLTELFRFSLLESVGLSSILHILFEAQEYYTDVLAKTHNVRGLFDTVNDLAVGVAGSILFALIYRRIRNKRQLLSKASYS